MGRCNDNNRFTVTRMCCLVWCHSRKLKIKINYELDFDLNFFDQLVSRKKAAKKKSPTPLTADMLNELNKDHMGGLENYGAEDMYNLDDTWDERRQDVKPKVKVSCTIFFLLSLKFKLLFLIFPALFKRCSGK